MMEARKEEETHGLGSLWRSHKQSLDVERVAPCSEQSEQPFWPVALIVMGIYVAIIVGISFSGIRVHP